LPNSDKLINSFLNPVSEVPDIREYLYFCRMKKLPLLLFSVLLLASCNNELDLTADFKDIPVVYGVFSKNDTDHYVRVEKAFIDEQIDAITLAGDVDNFTYDDVTVKISRSGVETVLERVDGAEEGLVRENGFFASSPNYLYKLSNYGLGSGNILTLIVDRGEGFELAEATAEIVSNIELKLPNVIQGGKLSILPASDEQTSITFKAQSNARVFDVYVDFHYREISAEGELSSEVVRWDFAKNQEADLGQEFQFVKADGVNFYNLLLEKIPVKPDVSRRFYKFSIGIVGGGKAIRDFTALTTANTGITSSQNVPNFSNLSNGLGIFSSQFTFVEDSISLSSNTLIELVEGDLLSELNFQ